MDYEKILEEQFNNVIDEETIDGIAGQAGDITYGLSQQFSLENIFNATVKGESIFNNPDVIDSLKDLFFYEVKSALVLAVEILSVCIIIGLLKNLSSSFSSKSVSDISMMVCTMVIIGLAINNFRVSYDLAIDTVGTMADTMAVLAPILLGIMVSTGAVTSGTVLSPLIIGSISGIALIVKTFILPALFTATILSLINCITEKDYVNKIAKLLRNASVAVMGLLMVILTGIISIQGLLTDTSDGLLINTAKYSLSSFIPIVGGFTSDTVELFLRCMSSIKSVVGVFGIILILLLILVPLIKIIIIACVYKLTAALCETGHRQQDFRRPQRYGQLPHFHRINNVLQRSALHNVHNYHNEDRRRMMESVFTWVKDVFFIIISLTFFQILIPNSNMTKYLKFIFSLIILAVILEPFASLVK